MLYCWPIGIHLTPHIAFAIAHYWYNDAIFSLSIEFSWNQLVELSCLRWYRVPLRIIQFAEGMNLLSFMLRYGLFLKEFESSLLGLDQHNLLNANCLMNVLAEMEMLPDAIVQYILSYMNNARDVAICNCVSKRWKDSTSYTRSLYFPRNSFDKLAGSDNPDNIVQKMISSLAHLEELVVYSPFSSSGLASWLSVTALSLRHLELRMDNLLEHNPSFEGPTKMDIVGVAKNLESMKLWGVLMIQPPKWDMFPQLKTLEIVGARLEEQALSSALQACPNLVKLLLLGCEGVRSLSIELPYLEECKIDFYGLGNCSLLLSSPRIRLLEVQGCSWIRVQGTCYLHSLSISNNSGEYF